LALSALFVFQFRQPLENEHVRLIGQLGDQRQVIATEAIGIVIFLSFIQVGPGERLAVEFLLAFIPRRKAFTGRLEAAAGVLLLSRRLSVF
jgi:hypothetical protein